MWPWDTNVCFRNLDVSTSRNDSCLIDDSVLPIQEVGILLWHQGFAYTQTDMTVKQAKLPIQKNTRTWHWFNFMEGSRNKAVVSISGCVFSFSLLMDGSTTMKWCPCIVQQKPFLSPLKRRLQTPQVDGEEEPDRGVITVTTWARILKYTWRDEIATS